MIKYYFFFKEGSKINQIICAVLLNLAMFSYGTCIGWMSPMALLLQSKESPRKVPLSDNEVSWMAAAPYIVCVPANYLVAYLGDKIGRKLTIIFMSVSCTALWAFKLSSVETWALVLARALVGIVMAGHCVVCPVYLKEISENNIRGALATLVAVFNTFGNLFSYVIGDMLSYKTVLWICLAIPILHIALFLMMPESPSYLVKHGENEKAAEAIAWLRCRSADDEKVQQELDVIKTELSNDEESSKFLFKAIFRENILLRAFGIATMVALAREICGAVTVLNFAGNIFDLASKTRGLVLNPNQQAMMLGAVQVFGSLLASSVVDITGRKPLLVVTSLVSGLCMCVLACWFLIQQHNVFTPAWLPMVSLCLCIFCDSAGLMPIAIIIAGEIFSYKYRGSVLAVTMAVASFMDFLLLLFFKTVASSIGVHVIFYFFGIVCLLNAAYVVIVIPETKNKTLEEIYNSLRTNKEKKQRTITNNTTSS